ncbi:hypothetical protein FHR70_002588 [Microvirga lupini]|uniref:Uncharacterized protein n=1 Tax=Microvirga lupini TaxID=420324 RepID=A0A7W4YY00_9HYPH|nr:hypothetical protein [Microvirga lupini]MBB3019523.1 hypothetical protein [Microvirga lupini]
MDAKLLKRLLEVPKQPLGVPCTLTRLGHRLDQALLLGPASLALGDVPVGLGEVLAFFPGVRHGADYAPNCSTLT